MSAIEQPAARSGRIAVLRRRRHDVGDLGHEMHAAEDDELGVGWAASRDSFSESPVRSAC